MQLLSLFSHPTRNLTDMLFRSDSNRHERETYNYKGEALEHADLAKYVAGNILNIAYHTIRIVDNGGIDGVTINDDGTIMIPAGVTPGEYTITYEVCLVNDSSVCVQQSVTFTVVGQYVGYPDAPNSGFVQRAAPIITVLLSVVTLLSSLMVGVYFLRIRHQ